MSAAAPARGRWAALIAGLAGAACAVAGLAFILFAPLPGAAEQAQAATLGRGIIDYRLEQSQVDLAAVPALVAEMGPERLRAGWTRVMVHWATLQPQAPGTPYEADADGDGYSDAYVAQLTAIVDALHSAGISVILTPLDTPKWASDKEWWQRPPGGYEKGKYYPFYAPDMAEPHRQAAVRRARYVPRRAVRGQGALPRVLERAQPGLLPLPADAGERQEAEVGRRTSRCSRRGTPASRRAPPRRSSSAEPPLPGAGATS